MSTIIIFISLNEAKIFFSPIHYCRVSPPILQIQLGLRHEQMPVLRQGTFIQFESSQKMNGVFVALLLREVIIDRFEREFHLIDSNLA